MRLVPLARRRRSPRKPPGDFFCIPKGERLAQDSVVLRGPIGLVFCGYPAKGREAPLDSRLVSNRGQWPRYVGYTGRPWASRPICEVHSLQMGPYRRLISHRSHFAFSILRGILSNRHFSACTPLFRTRTSSLRNLFLLLGYRCRQGSRVQ